MIQKGYRVYIEDDHCVIKDNRPRNQLIAKVPITSNHLFPLRIRLDMKGNTNLGVAFMEECKESDKHHNMEEKEGTEIQEAFQLEASNESWLWYFILGLFQG